jgi:methyl-accepting chemotaxis protein
VLRSIKFDLSLACFAAFQRQHRHIKPEGDTNMSFEEEVTKAIGAHGVWKMRLRTAINTGKTDANAADVAKDNACAFGQWLYGPTISASARTSPDYAAVRKLHADFHKCASKVIEHVGHGDKTQADAVMAGDYTKVSHELTAALTKWKSASH